MYRPRGSRCLAVNANGSQSSAGLPTREPFFRKRPKRGGMTPITVKGRPFNWMVRPTIPGSPPKRRCQRPWLRTVTESWPSGPSSGANVRPRSGAAPSVAKKFEVTPIATSSSGADWPVRAARKS